MISAFCCSFQKEMHPGGGTLRHLGGDAVGELMAEKLPIFFILLEKTASPTVFDPMVFPWDKGRMPRQGLGEFFGATLPKNDGTMGSSTHPLSEDGRQRTKRMKTQQKKIDPRPGP